MYNLSKKTLLTLGSISSVFPLSLVAMTLEISSVDHESLVGNINGEVVTNYSNNGEYQPFYWQSLSKPSSAEDSVISKLGENEPYLNVREMNENVDSVRFCIGEGSSYSGTSDSCSDWYPTKRYGTLAINNSYGGKIDVDFLDKHFLRVGRYIKAEASYDATGSELTFARLTLSIYNQEDERIISRSSRRTEASLSTLTPLEDRNIGVKACALVTYSSGVDSEEICSPLYSTALKERYQGVSIHTGNETIDTYDRNYKNNYVISILN
ncbi:hypothetical protein ACPV47_11825 [Vibrio jasicida]|uniref:hypothetical protein n=1 Tax=Vibrio jasicida TaxID=766224 RepID=UPI004068BAF2